MTLVAILDLASVFVFALTGALAASRAQLDLVGFIFLATLTGVGGGTLRDLVLDRTVVWVANPHYIGVICLAAVLVFFTAHLLESRIKALNWLDAFALAVAVPAGVGITLQFEDHWVVVMILGMMTGCMGGLMRDVVCNQVPMVLSKELYVTCALAGAGAAMGAMSLGLDQWRALILCAGVTFTLRAGSLLLGWKLPVYRSRPPRQ